MYRQLCGHAMALAFCTLVASLGCSTDNPDFDPAGTGTSGDAGCDCTLLDLRAEDLDVDLTNAADGDEVLPDGTFEMSWTVSYVADGCGSTPPSLEFVEQARVTRGVPSPQLEVAEETLTLAPGESLERAAESTEFFAVLGASDYLFEVWFTDVEPADAECPESALDNNSGDDAPAVGFNLPPA